MNISLKLCFAWELHVSACGATGNWYIAMLISFNSSNISLQIVIAGLDGVTAGYTVSKRIAAHLRRYVWHNPSLFSGEYVVIRTI